MRKTLYYIIPIIMMMTYSCSKEMSTTNEIRSNSEDSTLEAFSILLSRAIYAEPDLRYFMKKEALQKKDYDYDVFYPYVKDEIVGDNRTFEEILMQYDSEDILSSVTREHPLLTVLIPDWSWVNADCFSAERWDCSLPDVGVSYLSDSEEHQIYWNGEYAFSMRNGEFSSAPILIVKDNDRLVVDSQTKTPGMIVYSFFSDDFTDLSKANTKETKADHSTYTIYDLPYSVADSRVSLGLLTNRTASAYNVCNANPNVYQRDYIYYGMTSSTDTCYVNRNYYETLYKFKRSPDREGLWDDPEGSATGHDFKTKEYYYQANIWGNATKLTEAQIKAKSWGEGAAEIMIRVYAGSDLIKKNVSVSFADAFYVKKVELRENYNSLGALKSRTYYLGVGAGNYDEWLEPKWINTNLQLFYWDLSQFPTRYIVEFEEYDQSTKTIVTNQTTNTYAGNVSVSYAFNTSLKIGAGFTYTYSESETYSYETTQTSDDLGNFVVQYTDKIILIQNAAWANLKTYTTGSVDAQIITIFE